MDFKLTLLQVLEMPEFERVEYWIKKQSESGYNKGVFWRKLLDEHKRLEDRIEGKILEMNSIGNSYTNHQLPLLLETQMQINRMFGRNELALLSKHLIELGEAYGFNKENPLVKIPIYFYQVETGNIISKNVVGDEIPKKMAASLLAMNTLSFEHSLLEKQPEEISGYLDSQLWYFKKNGGYENDWIEHTKRLFIKDFSFEQKTAFLKWFEPINVKQKKHEKLTAPVIALFCSIVHQSTLDLMGEESNSSYCKRVCIKFKIPYSENVRKSFTPVKDIKKGDKNLKLIESHILPHIETESKQIIEQYINSKTKMYS